MSSFIFAPSSINARVVVAVTLTAPPTFTVALADPPALSPTVTTWSLLVAVTATPFIVVVSAVAIRFPPRSSSTSAS